jgi:hypothetical protein
LRHTFASLLIQQGESVAYVKEQMGHSSIQITVDVYGHLVPGGNRAAFDRLDDAQPSATQAQPDAVFAPPRQRVSRLQSVVIPTFASWNQLERWLKSVTCSGVPRDHADGLCAEGSHGRPVRWCGEAEGARWQRDHRDRVPVMSKNSSNGSGRDR